MEVQAVKGNLANLLNNAIKACEKCIEKKVINNSSILIIISCLLVVLLSSAEDKQIERYIIYNAEGSSNTSFCFCPIRSVTTDFSFIAVELLPVRPNHIRVSYNHRQRAAGKALD